MQQREILEARTRVGRALRVHQAWYVSNKTLSLANVPAFSDDNVDKQERFIPLIDILYDYENKLIMIADNSLDNFTSSRRQDLKFKRTCSSLS